MPLDPQGEADNYPRPSPDDGMGGNREHENAWIGGGSAKGNAGVKNFGTGRASQGSGGASGASAGSSSGSNSDPEENGPVEIENLPGGGTKETRKDKEGNTTQVTIRDANGQKGFEAERNDSGSYTQSHLAATFEDGSEMWVVVESDSAFGDPNGKGEVVIIHPSGSNGGGEAGRSDPRGDPQGGGGAGGDCLTLGIRCDVAESESGETLGEKMKEWARTNGLGGGGLTPGKVMEQAGQPVPTDPWSEGATGEVADPRTEAGLTPGCDAGPGGCAGGGDGGVAGSEVAGAAADDALDEASVDGSIAGMTPGCDASPDGCGGGSTGAAAEAGVESGAGEAAR